MEPKIKFVLSELESINSAAEVALQSALASQATEAQCTQCKAIEWVVPLDLPNDEAFLANYTCDECEDLVAGPGIAVM